MLLSSMKAWMLLVMRLQHREINTQHSSRITTLLRRDHRTVPDSSASSGSRMQTGNKQANSKLMVPYFYFKIAEFGIYLIDRFHA